MRVPLFRAEFVFLSYAKSFCASPRPKSFLLNTFRGTPDCIATHMKYANAYVKVALHTTRLKQSFRLPAAATFLYTRKADGVARSPRPTRSLRFGRDDKIGSRDDKIGNRDDSAVCREHRTLQIERGGTGAEKGHPQYYGCPLFSD